MGGLCGHLEAIRLKGPLRFSSLYCSSPRLWYGSGCILVLAIDILYNLLKNLLIMKKKSEVRSSHNKATYSKKLDVSVESIFARIGKHMVHLLHLLLR